MNHKLIEKYRDINVNHEDWHDCIIDYFIGEMEGIGIYIDYKEVHWSGFYSQGDGASFTCRFDPLTFMTKHHLVDTYPAAAFLATHDLLYITSNRLSSRYSHESTVEFTVSDEGYHGYDEETDDLREAVSIAMAEKFANEELHRLEQEVTDICRGYMRDLYHKLEQEYEDLTSDEQVWETIVANELEEEELDEDHCPC